MTVAVWVPGDSGALALGAEATARRLVEAARATSQDVRIRRNGSRGMYWLEPLVEVDCDGVRIGYGPVHARDVEGLVAAGMLRGAPHPLCLGPIDQHEWLRSQQRLTFARVGVTEPCDLDDYLAHVGFRGLRRALEIGPQATVKAVTDSGLRGRGGAAFPTGVKWQTVLDQPAADKFIACNADEGDSGTYADRMLMEGDPYALIEGMTIAGMATGARTGYVYLRVEYPHAYRTFAAAVERARAGGYLGDDVCGSGRAFDIDLRLGAGAYICGEETSMLESIEGKRGEVRVRPPLPAHKGLFGAPTVVNNVVTLATVPFILAEGADAYRDYGDAGSRGTLPLQLAGNIRKAGLVERAFGLTLRELLYDYGGGSASGRPLRAVQVGGPLGAFVPAARFDTPIEYESLAGIGAMLGHGGVVAFDDTTDMLAMARYALEFCAGESCGKCAPCRIGSVRGAEALDRVARGVDAERNLEIVEGICDTMTHGSLCGLGGMAPAPVLSAMKHFGEDFRGRRTGG